MRSPAGAAEIRANIQSLVDCERYQAARDLARDLLDDESAKLSDEIRHELVLWRVSLGDTDRPVSEGLLALEEIVTTDGVGDEVLSRAYGRLVAWYGLLRCPIRSQEFYDEAVGRLGETAELLLAKAGGALGLDDWDAAVASLDQARRLGGDVDRTTLAVARLRYVRGEFELSMAELDAVQMDSREWASAQRLRAVICAARDDSAGEVEALTAVIVHCGDGDRIHSDRTSLGLALATAGRIDEAGEMFLRVWREAPENQADFARQRVEHLESSGDDARRRRLKAFPTMLQKRDHCGPGVLELCLRFHDVDLTQDEIASTVMRGGSGTPMYEIVRFLEACGIAARRIEATPEAIRAAIDLGLPVIVQEEYSNSAHVAVITGYDEHLGLFTANDPMTHEPTPKPFSFTDRSGSMYGNGGVLLVGRSGPDLAPLQARLDEAGLIDARHLRLLDQADRQGQSLDPSGELESVAAPEVERLCAEALDLAPDFRLAHYRRWQALASLARGGEPGWLEEARRALAVAVTTYADEEWPHQIHAQSLLGEGRFYEAFAAFAEASRRDPEDASNRTGMGECKWLEGDVVAAEGLLLRALCDVPDAVWAVKILGAIYVDQLEDSRRDARRVSGVHPWSDPLHPVLALLADGSGRELGYTHDELRRRAEHFTRVASELASTDPFGIEVGGRFALVDGRWGDALAACDAVLAIDPGRLLALLGRAAALEHLGREVEAEAALAESLATHWYSGSVWGALSALQVRRGDIDAALLTLTRALGAVEGEHWAVVEQLRGVVAAEWGAEEAAVYLSDLGRDHIGDYDVLWAVVGLLESWHRSHAVLVLRDVLAQMPEDVEALLRLGHFLRADPSTRVEAESLFDRALELAPQHPELLRDLAWLRAGDGDPEGALALLDPVRDRDDAYVQDVVAALLLATGHRDEAATATTRALDLFGHQAVGAATLAEWHTENERYARAVELADHAMDLGLPAVDREWGEGVWLSAHLLDAAIDPILDTLRDLFDEEVPAHLAFDGYWACKSREPALAAKAALACAEQAGDPREALRFRARAAGELALIDDVALLDELTREARTSDDGDFHALLGAALHGAGRWDDWVAAIDQAMALAPENMGVLMGAEHLAVARGRLGEARSIIATMSSVHPLLHAGPERSSILLAKSFESHQALDLARRAVSMAAQCNVAHESLAIAAFVADDFELARHHAEWSLRLDPGTDSERSDPRCILQAIRGDASRLEELFEGGKAMPWPDPFPRWTDHLREVASRRSSG